MAIVRETIPDSNNTGAMTGSKNRLTTIMKRIVNSSYDSMEELVDGSVIYSIDEIHTFLDGFIAEWKENKFNPAVVYVLLKYVYMYLEKPGTQISFKNRQRIPIYYLPSFPPTSALLLYSYLKTSSFDVMLSPLPQTNRLLKEFVGKEIEAPVVIFTIAQFLHVQPLRQLVPYLHDRGVKIFIGGVPFAYDESLKQSFPDCIFPNDLTELTLLMDDLLKEQPG